MIKERFCFGGQLEVERRTVGDVRGIMPINGERLENDWKKIGERLENVWRKIGEPFDSK
jgi:hypothetical protein